MRTMSGGIIYWYGVSNPHTPHLVYYWNRIRLTYAPSFIHSHQLTTYVHVYTCTPLYKIRIKRIKPLPLVPHTDMPSSRLPTRRRICSRECCKPILRSAWAPVSVWSTLGSRESATPRRTWCTWRNRRYRIMQLFKYIHRYMYVCISCLSYMVWYIGVSLKNSISNCNICYFYLLGKIICMWPSIYFIYYYNYTNLPMYVCALFFEKFIANALRPHWGPSPEESTSCPSGHWHITRIRPAKYLSNRLCHSFYFCDAVVVAYGV